MSVQTIGDGIKTRLQTITGLRVFAPDELPDSINEFPAAVILPGETVYHAHFGGDADYTFRIIVMTGKQDNPSALNRLLPYLELTGTSSVKAAIETDATLNGSADDCKVVSNTGLGVTSWGGVSYLSTEFTLQVWK